MVLYPRYGIWLLVEFDETEKEKTAFSTWQGQFQWKVMPFGLCNAPATFARLMELILRELCWKICLVYIDDVIVCGNTFDETLHRFTTVWDRCRGDGLTMKSNKYKLFQTEVSYLGHTVSRHWIATVPLQCETSIGLPQ